MNDMEDEYEVYWGTILGLLRVVPDLPGILGLALSALMEKRHD